MNRIFTSAVFKVILGIVLIVGGVFLYTYTFNDNIITSFSDKILVPINQMFFGVARSASGLILEFNNDEQLKSELDSLKKEVRELRSLTVDYYETKKLNAQYEKYYEFKKENDSLKFVSASIIGRDPEEMFYGFTIDHGSSSGISVNDAVITENGLVGRVAQVSSDSARVVSILSPESKVGVIDRISGNAGVLSGSPELSVKNLAKMILIPSQNSIRESDMVVTSGLSGIYPRNIQIGRIRSIEIDEYDASIYAIVEPYENIKNVMDVFVITYFKGKGEIGSYSMS